MRDLKLFKLLLLFIVVIGVHDGDTADYSGVARSSNENIEFKTSIDGVLFLLTSVENKYKLIQVRVINNSGTPLRLSDDKDTVTLVFKDTQVMGILDVYRRDSAFWDALAPDVRDILAYPANVPGHEEESVFIFIPRDSPDDLPRELHYRIASLSNDIVIAPRGTGKE